MLSHCLDVYETESGDRRSHAQGPEVNILGMTLAPVCVIIGSVVEGNKTQSMGK